MPFSRSIENARCSQKLEASESKTIHVACRMLSGASTADRSMLMLRSHSLSRKERET
jgi:hypothetical protein